MKLLTTLAAGLVIALGLVASGRLEARAQVGEEGLAIYGRVMRPGTREPVVGARVLIEPGPDEERAIVTTDTEGRFRLTGLEAGEYEVSPVVSESADGPVGSATRSETVNLRTGEIPPDLSLWLPPRARVAGRITGPGGRPLPDVEVSFWRPGWKGQRTLIPALDSTRGPRTDDQGRYQLSAPPWKESRRVITDSWPWTKRGQCPRFPVRLRLISTGRIPGSYATTNCEAIG